jgi:hypothetical protein
MTLGNWSIFGLFHKIEQSAVVFFTAQQVGLLSAGFLKCADCGTSCGRVTGWNVAATSGWLVLRPGPEIELAWRLPFRIAARPFNIGRG